MSLPVTGRAGATAPSLDETVATQGAAPPLPNAPGIRTLAAPERNTLSQAPAASPGANSPREVPTGRVDYYRRREEDFRARNPGVQPPPYYLQYGDKYVRAFSALGPEQLSLAGLEWRDKALKLLQVEMEKARREDGLEFAKLERQPEDFRKFAYKTHVTAYLEAGLLSLSTQDLTTILTTPDLQDLLNKDGLEQILEVLDRVGSKDVATIVNATSSQVRQELQDQAERMDREVKSFMYQRWWDGGMH
ncbi:hypothetical protein D187_004700 [Cystobacter fuscus DSM 2262]|uniref:Uncharacterized protein n=1 Tax=Cystobacter fuscus (strain ATCC 25194 / DSM 2262 / NBRC 100088 / M29) TaxID=1242864 RepID=S9P3S9_CYSF2|nr:hypothetical protein [Cystobacter fuscus]EPX57821.1 hypothetical protein D187_004700 [Cystobacter fuscus DSM 2262]